MAKIVLVADRTLTADYKLLLEGILGTVNTTITPEWLYKSVFSREPILSSDKQLIFAPYGLRKLQEALTANSFSKDEVIVTTVRFLPFWVNNETRIIGASSGDPLGMGMTSTTVEALWDSLLYTKKYFYSLAKTVNKLKSKNDKLRFCYGGPGAWQFVQRPQSAKSLGIDHVFVGYSERTIPKTFIEIIKGKTLPLIIYCEPPLEKDLRPITEASSMGVVEISRWCGRGCKFCTLKDLKMMHIPIEIILQEVKVNIAAGMRNISLISEDFLRYGSESVKVRKEKVQLLLEKISKVENLNLLQLDHVNISSIAQFRVEKLKELWELASLSKNNKWLWVNAGIETASPRLLSKIAPGKAAPFKIDSWPELVKSSISKLNDAGFFPFLSIILGAPGEREEDILESIELLDEIKGERAVVFPILYVGVDKNNSFLMKDMSKAHWELFKKSYQTIFRWLPKVLANNQKAGKVRLFRRIAMQLVGRLSTLLMQRRMKMLSKIGG